MFPLCYNIEQLHMAIQNGTLNDWHTQSFRLE